MTTTATITPPRKQETRAARWARDIRTYLAASARSGNLLVIFTAITLTTVVLTGVMLTYQLVGLIQYAALLTRALDTPLRLVFLSALAGTIVGVWVTARIVLRIWRGAFPPHPNPTDDPDDRDDWWMIDRTIRAGLICAAAVLTAALVFVIVCLPAGSTGETVIERLRDMPAGSITTAEQWRDAVLHRH